MREFTQREIWLFVMTVMHTSQLAKSLPKEQRVAIEEAIRKEHCPQIDYPEWLEIEKNIVKNKYKVLDKFMTLFGIATGTAKPQENDIHLLEMLDKNFINTINNIDFEEIKRILPDQQSENTKRILSIIKTVENMKKDLNAGK